MLTRVGLGFFQFMQDISVLFAISKDKASLFPQKHSQLLRLLPPSTLSVQSGIKVRLRVVSGETSTHFRPVSDLAHTLFAALPHFYRPGVSQICLRAPKNAVGTVKCRCF